MKASEITPALRPGDKTAAEVWDILHTPEGSGLRFVVDKTWVYTRAQPVGVFHRCYEGGCCDDTETDREAFVRYHKNYTFEPQQ
jgi:hypothetical protein